MPCAYTHNDTVLQWHSSIDQSHLSSVLLSPKTCAHPHAYTHSRARPYFKFKSKLMCARGCNSVTHSGPTLVSSNSSTNTILLLRACGSGSGIREIKYDFRKRLRHRRRNTFKKRRKKKQKPTKRSNERTNGRTGKLKNKRIE